VQIVELKLVFMHAVPLQRSISSSEEIDKKMELLEDAL